MYKSKVSLDKIISYFVYLLLKMFKLGFIVLGLVVLASSQQPELGYGRPPVAEGRGLGNRGYPQGPWPGQQGIGPQGPYGSQGVRDPYGPYGPHDSRESRENWNNDPWHSSWSYSEYENPHTHMTFEAPGRNYNTQF